MTYKTQLQPEVLEGLNKFENGLNALELGCETAHKAVFSFKPVHRVHSSKGLTWTNRLHKTLVSLCDSSVAFTGYRNGVIAEEHERADYSFISDNDGFIIALEVTSTLPFTPDEMNAMKKVAKLYGTGEVAVVRLLGFSNDQPTAANHFVTETPALLYTSPRAGRLHRSAQAQILNTIFWALHGNRVKLQEFEQLDEYTIAADIPFTGRVSAKVTQVVQDVETQRGERKAALPVGFHMEIHSEKPIAVKSVGYNRKFGSGKLIPIHA